MDVLISEDDDYKYEKVEKAIRKSLPDCNIHRTTCIRDTIEYLHGNNVDALIQDMNLPVWKDDTIRCAAGIDVVYTVGIEDIPIKFRFVCSSDESFKDDFGEDFDGFGFKFVHFEASKCLDNSFKFN